jgi:LL-diaminopimelate aminotransferase
MIRINEHYLKLQSSYLFTEIEKRVNLFSKKNPQKKVIKLGIGDVTKALPDACIKAFHNAVDEMACDTTFKGYGPSEGYEFLRTAVVQNDFNFFGLDISSDEIFISDGSKCDTANIQELFSNDINIAVPDPVYPVYVDTNVMAGRTQIYRSNRYQGLVYLEATEHNNFIPDIPGEKVDLIYLCFPNNPTGATVNKEQLTHWVEYAKEAKALILFDAAYTEFIRDPEIPKSIYEIKGAQEVAVEFRSFSKNAGFAGIRCAYTVVPKRCLAYDSHGKIHYLHSLWNRRISTKFNGVSYPVQKAAEAVYSSEGKKQTKELCDYYLKNAHLISESLKKCNYFYVGGENSPYIWVKAGMDSWEYFDLLLNKTGIVCTPGTGFGSCGDGYVRFSAFNSYENVKEAMDRLVDFFEIQ